MLDAIGDVDNVAGVHRAREGRRSEALLMGFGHRVYKNYDPRAKLMQETCKEFLSELGLQERPALQSWSWHWRKSRWKTSTSSRGSSTRTWISTRASCQRAIGFDPAAFTVLFGVGRTVGWLCHYDELMSGEFKITRPARGLRRS